MDNKYLQIKKENIFTKFINFIENLFENNKDYESPPQLEMVKRKETSSSNFSSELQLNKDDNQTLLNLQKQFENNEIDLNVMSDEEIDALNSLYKKQVSELKKILDNKQTELNIIQYRIKGYSSNK